MASPWRGLLGNVASLTVRVYARRMSHQIKWANAFAAGLIRHGIRPEMAGPPRENYQRSDVAVFWSHRFAPKNQHYVVLEQGYVSRGTYVSAGWNGLNGRADFCNKNVPSDRGERFYDLLEPCRFGQYILIMGQVRGDEAIRDVDFPEWAAGMVGEAQKQVSKEVCFRAHPRDQAMQIPCARVIKGSLDAALEGAHWVITYNSSSAVEAALAGIPVSACDEGSMAWEVAGHGAHYRFASLDERKRWLDRLAYAQWTEKEMRDGDAWEHLKQRLN